MFVLSGEVHLFHVTKDCSIHIANKNNYLAMSIEINKGEWWCLQTHITLTRESCSSPTPSSNHEREYEGHIPFAESYRISEVFLSKQTRVHAPWVWVMPPNHSRSSGGQTGGWWDITHVKRPFRDGIQLFSMCEPGNESWSTSLTTLPSCGKDITLKSEEKISPMQ